MKFHGGVNTENYLDFSVNVPIKKLDACALPYMQKAMDQVYRYPSIDCEKQRERLSEVLGAATVIGSGATQLIYAISRSLHIKKSLLLEPTFTEYRSALEMGGATIFCYNALNFASPDPLRPQVMSIDEEELLQHLNRQIEHNNPDVVFICNPNNPLGTYFSPTFIQGILENETWQGTLIVDESFMDFVDDQGFDLSLHQKEVVQLIETFPNRLIVLRSMTKAFSVPGLRLGYCFTSEGLRNQLLNGLEPWSVNIFAIEFMNYVLDYHLLLNPQLPTYKKIKEDFIDGLGKIDFVKKIYDSKVHYVLMETDKSDLNTALNQKGINIRQCHDFIFLGDTFYRVNIRKECDVLLKAMEEICQK